MSEPGLKLLHIAPWVRTTGGIETLLARHAQTDARVGLEAHQVSLFDRIPALPGEAYTPLGFSWKSTPRGMRRVMAQLGETRPGRVAVWHSGWGLPWLADLDGAHRRILYLHDSIDRYAAVLPHFAGLVDGVMCNSNAVTREVPRWLPGLTAERLAAPPLPIAPPAGLDFRRPENKEWVVGCFGRVERVQKRLDRLVPFMAEIHRLGLKCQVEVMGDGSLLPWLKRRLGADRSVQFLGHQGTASYWRRLQTWDAVISFSDNEGGPITLLAAMAAGVIPLYPAIGGGLGDDYTPQVDPRGYYPAGDLRAAALALQALQASSPAEIAAMRQRAHALVQPHATGEYERVFAALVRRVAGLPRISRECGRARKTRPVNWLPLGLITRVWPEAIWR